MIGPWTPRADRPAVKQRRHEGGPLAGYVRPFGDAWAWIAWPGVSDDSVRHGEAATDTEAMAAVDAVLGMSG